MSITSTAKEDLKALFKEAKTRGILKMEIIAIE